MSHASVEAYLASLPPDRRTTLQAVREVILANLPAGYEEGIQYGSIGYYVPHSICPDGYHCDGKQPVPFAGLANGKAKFSLHLFGMYVMPEVAEQLATSWKETGKRLDMGKSCVRFKKLEDVPLDVVGAAIASMPLAAFVERYEGSLPAKVKKKRGSHK
ncbi:MAG: DUF1801 domain-containing protein [Myxococcales bacterium]|nr:DUF1801 domain-containing protein [Myxococcales bacterium]